MKKFMLLVAMFMAFTAYASAQYPNSKSSSSYYHSSVTEERVLANSTDTYSEVFVADVNVVVYVEGDGDTDLDLYIYDESGNLIDSDTDNTDRCYCEWTPRWRGKFTIKIKNLGSVYNAYTMYVLQ